VKVEMGGVVVWERLVARIFLAYSLVTSPMLLDTRFDITLGFTNKSICIHARIFSRPKVHIHT
jgi:hypothetical protein